MVSKKSAMFNWLMSCLATRCEMFVQKEEGDSKKKKFPPERIKWSAVYDRLATFHIELQDMTST